MCLFRRYEKKIKTKRRSCKRSGVETIQNETRRCGMAKLVVMLDEEAACEQHPCGTGKSADFLVYFFRHQTTAICAIVWPMVRHVGDFDIMANVALFRFAAGRLLNINNNDRLPLLSAPTGVSKSI